MNVLLSKWLRKPKAGPAEPQRITNSSPSEKPMSSISDESRSILRRGNWDYMWRRARDQGAQLHPEFEPDEDPGFATDDIFGDR